MGINTLAGKLHELFPIINAQIWLISVVFIFVFALLLFSWSVNLLLKALVKKADTTKMVWDELILNSIKPPIRLLIWVVGISYIAESAWKTFSDVDLAPKISMLFIIYALAWFAIRLLNGMDRNIVRQGGDYEGRLLDAASARAINKLLRISVIITAVLLAMQTLGYNLSGVLAFGGVGGLIVGLAAKDLLANFFGGLMIYLDRPFQEGRLDTLVRSRHRGHCGQHRMAADAN